MNRRRPAFLGVLALVVAACAAPGASPTASPPDSMPPETAGPSLPAGDVPLDLLETAVADAAERAGVDATAISLVAAETVTWRDGSLGCPEPGMMYTQALVPGFRVILEAGGEELHFHGASSGGGLRYCADPEPPAEESIDG